MLTKEERIDSASIWNEELYFVSDLYSQGILIAQGIRSKLILNKIKYKEPLLLLYPPREKVEDIDVHFEIEIKGRSEFVGGGGIATEIHIPKAHVMHSSTTHFAPSWQESSIEVSPDEVYQKHYLQEQGDKTPEKAWVIFLLTKNNFIGPWGTSEMSFTGEVKRKFKPRVVLNLENGWLGTFTDHYKYIDMKSEGIEGYLSSSNLVFSLERAGDRLSSLEEIHVMSDLLDKLLLYVSLATRQRTSWVAWISEVENKLIEYYRDIAIPSKSNEYGETLIDKRLIEEFLKHSLRYISNKENLDLYLPLVYLVSTANRREAVESQFLSLFMSLEALLHLYGKKKDKTKSSSLYYKFCKTFEIDNSDLWPVFGSGRSLYSLRSKLVHGILSGDGLFWSYARINLKWIVERCLLAMIGWVGYGKESNVDSETLRKFDPYREWKQYYGRIGVE